MPELTERIVEHPPEYHGKGITTSTKFMQQYREASPVDGGKQGCAIRNKAGQVELFTIGTDRTVWNYYPDPRSDTGYSKADIGLKGDAIDAGVDGSGLIWLFAVASPKLYYVSQSSVQGQRWSTPVEAKWMQKMIPTRTDAVFTRNLNGRLYVGVRGRGPGCSRWWSVWPDTSGNFWGWPDGVLRNKDYDRNYFVFSNAGDPPVGLAFMCGVGQAFAEYKAIECIGHPNFQGENPPWISKEFRLSSQPENALSVDIAADKFGIDQLFGVFADGNVYRTLTANGKWLDWEQLSDTSNFQQVWAVKDLKGDTHIICLAANKSLYHLQPTAEMPDGYGTPAEIGGGILSGRVQWATVARNNGNQIELYLALTGPGTPLVRMGLEQSTGRWQDTPIAVQPDSSLKPKDKIKTFISYSTDVSVTNEVGAPMANAPVTVRAGDRTTITVNGDTTEIDQTIAAHLNLNAAGQLSITQETDSLGVPALWVHIEGLMPADQVLIIEQYADGHDAAGLPAAMKSVENRLATVTADDLKKAKDAGGKPLLEDKGQASRDSMATAFNQCMKLPDREKSRPGTLHPLLARQGPRNGVHIGSQAEAIERMRVTQRPDLPSWTLSFEDGRASYQTLTPEEAQTRIDYVTKNNRAAADPEGKSWWSTIGDFLEAVVDGFFKLGEMIIDGVNATFQFVIDGVSYFFNAVVNFVQDAFDMVESILATAFKSIEKFFEKTFEWLGFLFSWEDILIAHDALKFMMNQYFDFVSLALGGVHESAGQGLTNLRAQIPAIFSQVRSFVGTGSVKNYEDSKRQPDPKFSYSTGNNFLTNELMDNPGAVSEAVGSLPAVNSPQLDGFMTKLEQFWTVKKTDNAYKAGEKDVSKLKGSDIFTESVLKILELAENLSYALLDGVTILMDAAFAAIAEVLGAIKTLLNAPLTKIPFVSDFYSYITNGSDLTLMDLLALMIAIPTTTLFKLVKGASPFANKTKEKEFESMWPASVMVSKSGLVKSSTMTTETAAGLSLTPDDTQFFAWASGAAEMYYYAFSAVNDSGAVLSVAAGKVLAWFTVGAEVAAAIFSFPWFSSTKHANMDDHPEGASNAAWCWGTFAGIPLDIFFVVKYEKISENYSDLGVFATLAYTVLTSVFAINACPAARPLDQTLHVMPLLPGLFKVGLCSGWSVYLSKWVAAGDLLFGAIIASLTIAQGYQVGSEPTPLPALPAA